ncbi:hypothetical protein [Streptomyces drozdowiczii]|uniref:Uncharacterized protein n=1 Tax=Streptomyces drozdowiczii TaxID=202862 RepID=A0ABY6PKG8_9ACTN|nr:hypothetical protein [Streptomyces drozdowiczii]MCX0247862.1 hypothetical protein [Streptomyces drozdowiczii]UZK52779.1 hypothetical protein NEH16_00440 [Streptomyces drozdowiczii]
MSSAVVAGSGPEVLVGRCYTRARRHPLMIGRWPGGRGRIWGGPYTVPQMVVLAGSLTLLLLTRAVWAHFGLLNYVLALGMPYGLSLLVRHVQVDGRSPLAVAGSSLGLLTRPSGGRLGGRPLKDLRGRRPLIGVCSITWAPERPVHGGAGGAPMLRAHRAGATVRSASVVPPGLLASRRSAALDQDVVLDPSTGGARAAGRGAAGAGAGRTGKSEVVVERRPVPVAAALLAARRRGVRDDVSDPRTARRGV